MPMSKVFKIVIVALLLVLAFKRYFDTPKASSTGSYERDGNLGVNPDSGLENIKSSAHFSCDGRDRCSQMTSCEEAKFFLENCPGTRMDGDGDGVPCENQWCN
jgi:hypothetical protein